MKKQNKKKCQTAGPIWRPLLRTIFWASHNRRGELLVFYYFFMGTWFTLTVLSVLLRVFFFHIFILYMRVNQWVARQEKNFGYYWSSGPHWCNVSYSNKIKNCKIYLCWAKRHRFGRNSSSLTTSFRRWTIFLIIS